MNIEQRDLPGLSGDASETVVRTQDVERRSGNEKKSGRRRGLRLLAASLGVLATLGVARPAAADIGSNWGGRGHTAVECSPYSHTMTTGVTITSDSDMISQAVRWYRYIDLWNGASWIQTYVDRGDMLASSIPSVTTTRQLPGGYYRVRMTYMWSNMYGGTRASGTETIPVYLQHGNTWATKESITAVSSYCVV